METNISSNKRINMNLSFVRATAWAAVIYAVIYPI